MYFIGKYYGPRIKEFISDIKSKYPNYYKFHLCQNLRANVATWWQLLNTMKTLMLLG
jgi:hypothetical protein